MYEDSPVAISVELKRERSQAKLIPTPVSESEDPCQAWVAFALSKRAHFTLRGFRRLEGLL